MLKFVMHVARVVCNTVLDLTAKVMLTMPGHRGCCRPPAWTAYVGQPWDTFDRAPWNLFNAWWRAGQWAMAR